MIDFTQPDNINLAVVATTQAIRDDDVSLASKWAAGIKGFLAKKASTLDPVRLNQLQQSLKQLQAIRLAALSDKDFDQLLTSDLVDICRLPEYNLIDKIGTRISFEILPDEQNNLVEHIKLVLENSLSPLGNSGLVSGGRNVPPTVKNWLEDYKNFPSSGAQRTDLDEINYLNKSPNASVLPQPEKEILLEILKVYDSLANKSSSYRSLPQPASEEEAFKNFDLYDFVPGLITDENEKAAPAAAPSPLAVNSPKPLPAQPKPNIPPSLAGKARPGGANVNMQDILNRRGGSGGIVYDNETNVKVEEIGQRIEAERQQKQSEIDQKLADLKKRQK